VSESKTSVRRLQAIERQRQALELRLAGTTLPEIARVLGYASASGAAGAIDSAIRRMLQEPAEKVRAYELARLDRLLMAIWPAAIRGDLQAIRRALDIMERRAKYLGLDAPAKVDISGMVREEAQRAGLSPDDVDAAVREADRIARGAD
jgi:hypothetical protein